MANIDNDVQMEDSEEEVVEKIKVKAKVTKNSRAIKKTGTKPPQVKRSLLVKK